MLLNFEPNIDKQYILSKVSEEDILSYYTQQPIKYGVHILSPIRQEKHPSFSYVQTKNGILWRDWGSGKSGDVFNLLEEKYGITFKESLCRVYEDLIKNKGYVPKSDKEAVYSVKNKLIDIYFEFQPFNSYDIEYWSQYHIDLRRLVEYDVKSVKSYSLVTEDETHTFKSTSTSPIYYYWFSNTSYKIYRPYISKKYKFLYKGNKDTFQGENQLDRFGELLIITKSLKDVMCLRNLGYNAIAPQGEGYRLSTSIYERLRKRFTNIVSLYDNDDTGKLGAKNLYDQYGIKSYFIPLEYNSKDISDYCKNFGYDALKTFVTELLKQ